MQYMSLSLRFLTSLNVCCSWWPGKDTGTLSHLAIYDFNQPGQNIPHHTSLEALLEVQHHSQGLEHWAPLAVLQSVAGTLPEHENTEYTRRHLWCSTSWPQTWCYQYGHAAKANQYLVSVHTSTYLYVLVCTCTYLWWLTQGVVRVTPQHNLAGLVQDTVCLLEIPFGLLASLLRKIFLEEIKQVDSLLL